MKWFLLFLLTILLVTLIGGYFLDQHSDYQPYYITIEAKYWSNTLEIWRYGKIASADWCNALPENAFNVRRKEVQYTTIHHVNYNEEAVQDYDTLCYYSYYAWLPYYDTKTAGTDKRSEYWGLPRKVNCRTVDPCQEVRNRVSLYSIRYNLFNRYFICAIPYDLWLKLEKRRMLIYAQSHADICEVLNA